MIRFIIFVLLIGIPIAEVAVFMVVGSIIGVLPTILIIILTALIGAGLLKRQGVSALAQLQDDLRNERVPAASIGSAVTIAIAGLMLLTPGFITDAVGFALFVPAVRRWLWRRVSGSVKVVGMEGMADPRQKQRRGERTIDLEEGEYSRSDDHSPWQNRPTG
ncbi:MAG: FxsA family protein [Pseudomonadota bacterium]